MLVILLLAVATVTTYSDMVDSSNELRQTEQIFNDVESGSRSKRQVLKNFTYPNSTWKNGIFYSFNTSDDLVRKLFKMGIKVWSENTCIDFVENRNAEDKVVVINGDGCWSSIGQRGRYQILSLGGCFITEHSAVHEIGHVRGLFHTMQRYDRDNFIIILVENMNPSSLGAFSIADRDIGDVYGLSYDYGGAMHYTDITFSSNNHSIMIATNPLYQKTMGSELISFSDIYMVNQHHGCNAICNKTTSAKCANEGFPHPRNCSICICAGGYGGELCDQRPPGCGENLDATRRKKAVTYTLDAGPHLQDHFYFCNYMITAPEGNKIEVNVQAISYGYDLPGCPKGGIEVKSQVDQKLTGYRFCAMNGSGGPILSSSNRLPLILFNKSGSMKIKFTYRSV